MRKPAERASPQARASRAVADAQVLRRRGFSPVTARSIDRENAHGSVVAKPGTGRCDMDVRAWKKRRGNLVLGGDVTGNNEPAPQEPAIENLRSSASIRLSMLNH
jgi:hypothetical protein